MAQETTIRAYFIGAVVLTFIIVGGLSMIMSVQQSDDTFVNSTEINRFNQSFNTYNSLTGNISNLESGLKSDNSTSDYGSFGVLNSLIQSAWQVFRSIPTTFAFIGNIFLSLSTFFGVPVWIPTLILSIISIIIVFSIYSLIFQRST